MKTVSDLLPSWRWFGPEDAITLAEIRQAGATGIVSALHHIPCGEVWLPEAILQRKQTIEEAGLRWVVVESVNIHESIKTAASDRDLYIQKYQQTLRNLAEAGIHIVCYNFMPVLDWTRTHLSYRLEDGSYALRYDAVALAAFDLYILKRPEAAAEFTADQQQAAKAYLESLSEKEIETLRQTILAGLPGTDEVFTIEEFRQHLSVYENVGAAQLKENLSYFLQAIIPVAESCDMLMCIHPDDPPFPVLGLPRVVSTEQDLTELIQAVPSRSNGITFCTGSLGGRKDNDLPGMIRRLGNRIHFLHLRNVLHEENGSFHEAPHLGGSTDMYEVMRAVIEEQYKRALNNLPEVSIPMRPDHGHQLSFDSNRRFYPGYSAVGRLKGLAELRGLEMGIKRTLQGD